MSDYGLLERFARRAGSAGLSGRLAAWIILGGPSAARQAHRDAWVPELLADPGGRGYSVFQLRTEETLLAQFGKRGLTSARGRDTSGTIALSAPGPISVLVMNDEVRLTSPTAKLDITRWDVRTPHELRDCVIETLRRLLPATPAA